MVTCTRILRMLPCTLPKRTDWYVAHSLFSVAIPHDRMPTYMEFVSTLQPLYNTVRYKTVLDITRFKDGTQKCIDYIEK